MKSQHKILSSEMPIPSADETLTIPEIPPVPSSVIPSNSIPVQIAPGASPSRARPS